MSRKHLNLTTKDKGKYTRRTVSHTRRIRKTGNKLGVGVKAENLFEHRVEGIWFEDKTGNEFGTGFG
jgi:hypothetical protein